MSARNVRRAILSDIAQIEMIYEEARPQSGRQILGSSIESLNSFYVLEDSGLVAGFLEFGSWENWSIVGGMEDCDPGPGGAIFLRLFVIAGDKRNDGLGSTLLGGWLAQLPMSVQYVVLDAAPAGGRDAEAVLRRFYARQGFRLLPLSARYSGMEPYLMGWSRPGMRLPDVFGDSRATR